MSKALVALIEKAGTVSVADYMQLALQHPEFGYYRHGNPIGQGGDFITAPEISQMFGEMLGLWCADVWRQMGKPDPFVLLEMGPGRGTLMQDMLRATAKISGFHQAMQLYLLESSETLREIQKEKFKEHNPQFIQMSTLAPPSRSREGQGGGLNPIENSIQSSPPLVPSASGRETLAATSLPQLPTIVIANEFFDALPIRQFEKTFNGWCERLVTIIDGVLAFTFSPPDEAIHLLIPHSMREATPGAVYELSPVSINLMRDLAQHITANTGAALIIDYAYNETDGKPTLQAVANHRYADVLANPGEADITALVDYGLLRRAAEKVKAITHGPINQGTFLHALGIQLRADQLKLRASESQAEDIDKALHRLTDVAEMGSLFKALAISSSQLTDLPGF